MDVLEKQMQEPSGDLISRQSVLNACEQSINILEAVDRIMDLPSVEQEPKTEQEDDYFRKIVEVAISQLRADRDRLEDELAKREQEPKTGHWVRFDNGKYHWYLCSCCDAMAGSDEKMMAYKYCPNCGAKMESEG
jgi:hypothetical protein